jgi:UDP-N-acetyl-D-mannosaminuronic acid transferase (WecB/TagA/CpsF family)
MKKVNILNVSIDNISKQELLEKLTQQGGILITPNVDHLIKIQKDREFYQLYKLCNYRVCDSQIIFLAAKFLGYPLKEKISGSDFFPNFISLTKIINQLEFFCWVPVKEWRKKLRKESIKR